MIGRPTTPIDVLFWKRVRRTHSKKGCWLWQGGKTRDGYGKFQVSRTYSPTGRFRTTRAHHVAWFLSHGEWPPQNLQVRHTCDTPLCVRPDHLLLGTLVDNVRDMVERGRRGHGNQTNHARGEKCPWTKLTQKQVLRIRAATQAGATRLSLAQKFGVAACTINDIVRRRSWAWLV